MEAIVFKNNINILICWQPKLQSGEPMDRWIGSIGLMDRWIDGSMEWWMEGWIDKCIDGWMDGSIDWSMDILING